MLFDDGSQYVERRLLANGGGGMVWRAEVELKD